MKTCVQCKHYQLPDFCKHKGKDIHSIYHYCEHFEQCKEDKDNGKEKVHIQNQ